MKKVLITVGIVLTVIIVALAVIPIFFKGKIVTFVKTEANKKINAKLDFQDVGLNLFSHFPDVTLTISDLSIVNYAPFEGDTLMSVGRFQSTVDLISLIRGKTIRIVGVEVDDPVINLLALKDGRVNWDIQKGPKQTATGPSELNLALQKYAIRHGRLRYLDQASDMRVVATDLNHSGSGDFTKDAFRLQTLTDINALTIASGGLDYLNKVHTKLKANLDVNANENRLTLQDNELQLNDLVLTFDGSVAAQPEETAIDLNFKTLKTDFKSILSLIPAVYSKEFADLQTSGTLALNGFIKGQYSQNNFPAFGIQLGVENGMFKYPRLPQAVNEVNVDLQINCPGGNLDKTVVNLRQLHLRIGQEPFDARLLVTTPISDPYLVADFSGKINLVDLKNAFPLENQMELSGLISTKLQVAGRLSDIRENQYDKIRAAGDVTFQNINYASADLPQKMTVSQAQLGFTPEKVVLRNLQATFGQSDIRASGGLENVLAFVFGNQPLRGALSTTSNFFDLNPFLQGPSNTLTAVQLPGNVEFTLSSQFNEVLYGKLKLQKVSGALVLKDRTLSLKDLKMSLLAGSALANGSYATPPNSAPRFAFNLNINAVSIPQTFESFVSVQKFVPIAQSMQGNYSATLQVTSDLDTTLTPIWNTFGSQGSVDVIKATVSDFKPLTLVANTLKLDKLKSFALQNLTAHYDIRGGRFYLKPTKINIDNIGFVVSGWNGLDKSINYSLTFSLPAKELNQQGNAALSSLFKRKLDLLGNESLLISAQLGGTYTDPKIETSLQNIIKGPAEQVQNLAQQELDKQKSLLADSVKAQIDQQKQELERLKKLAEERAKAKQDSLKKEAAKKLKKLLNP